MVINIDYVFISIFMTFYFDCMLFLCLHIKCVEKKEDI